MSVLLLLLHTNFWESQFGVMHCPNMFWFRYSFEHHGNIEQTRTRLPFEAQILQT